MSSQALATAPLGGGGLPSAPSPPNMPAPLQMDESWNKHMQDYGSQTQVQNQTQNQREETLSQAQHVATSAHDRAPSTSTTTAADDRVQQHRQALSNLMAALNQSNGPKPEQTDTVNSQAVEMSNANVVPGSDNQIITDTANNNSATPPLLPTQSTTFEPLLNGITAFTDPFPPLAFDNNILPSNLPPSTTQDLSSSMGGPFLFDMTNMPRAAPRKIGAFAKLNFDDGHYYMSTYQIELGRDAIAYQDALRREKEEKDGLQLRAQSSSGRMSRHSDRIKRGVDSQLQGGSVVSEAGGFAGLDDIPTGADGIAKGPNSRPTLSSQLSSSDLVNPNDLSLSRAFDYAKRGDEMELFERSMVGDIEQPAPVTAEHMPDPSICPLIPIHAMTDSEISELATHKMISRRHARIEWSGADESFVIQALGRNGLFVDDGWYQQKSRRLLKHGAVIQIAGIQIRFELPNMDESEPDHDTSLPSYDGASPERPRSITPISTIATPEETTPQPTKVTLKLPNKRTSGSDPSPPAAQPVPLLGPDGQPIIRKRGPGRPPKDGIMSTRERKEREKAAKAAELKAANGGTTPPPMSRGKITKPPTKEELARIEAARQERKKLANNANTNANAGVKRRREEDGEVMPSIEGGEETPLSDTEKQPVKKARQSKSPSPDYPAEEALTEEQLARPSEPYARLIYDILIEIYPKALPLKQIYRAIKLKFPFFVHRVDSDGWQSSVRHNLNQEWTKLFDKGEKEGKGFAWKAIPGALQPAAERRKAAQAAAASKPKPAQQRQQNQHNQNQPGYWPNGYPQQPNGMPWPAGQGPQNARGHQRAQPAPLPLPAPGASNMPCTFDGYLAIRRFEQVMCEHAEKNPGSIGLDRLRAVFMSVKARALHGAPSSTLPGFESAEEKTILAQVKAMVEKYKNPAFQGYQVKPLSRGQSPAVHAAAARRSSVSGAAQGQRPQSAGQQGQHQPHFNPAQQGPQRQPSTPLARSTSAAAPGQQQGQTPQNPSATAMHYPPPSSPYPAQGTNASGVNGGQPVSGQVPQQYRPNTPNANGGPMQGQVPQQNRPNTPNANAGPPSQLQRPPPNAYPQQPQSGTPQVNGLQRPPSAHGQQQAPGRQPAQFNGQLQRPPSQNGQQPPPNQHGSQQAYAPMPNQQQHGQQQPHPSPSFQQPHMQPPPGQQPGALPQPVQQPIQQPMPKSSPQSNSQQHQPGFGQQHQASPVQPVQQPSTVQATNQPTQQDLPQQASDQPPQAQTPQQQPPLARTQGSNGVPQKSIDDVAMADVPPPPAQFQTVGQATAAAANGTPPGKPSSGPPPVNGNGTQQQQGSIPPALGDTQQVVDSNGDVQMTGVPSS